MWQDATEIMASSNRSAPLSNFNVHVMSPHFWATKSLSSTQSARRKIHHLQGKWCSNVYISYDCFSPRLVQHLGSFWKLHHLWTWWCLQQKDLLMNRKKRRLKTLSSLDKFLKRVAMSNIQRVIQQKSDWMETPGLFRRPPKEECDSSNDHIPKNVSSASGALITRQWNDQEKWFERSNIPKPHRVKGCCTFTFAFTVYPKKWFTKKQEKDFWIANFFNWPFLFFIT